MPDTTIRAVISAPGPQGGGQAQGSKVPKSRDAIKRAVVGAVVVVGISALAVHVLYLLPDPESGTGFLRSLQLGGSIGVASLSLPLLAALRVSVWAFPIVLLLALSANVLARSDAVARGSMTRLAVAGATAVLVLLPATALRPRLPVAAAEGTEMIWVTEPSLVESAYYGAMERLDGTPCTFNVLEWDAAGRLYYQSDCVSRASLGGSIWGTEDGVAPGSRRRVWMFDPAQGRAPQPVAASPGQLVHQPSRTANRQLVHAAGLQARSGLAAQPILGSSPELRSTDGRWAARVVTMHYEPEHVILVRVR